MTNKKNMKTLNDLFLAELADMYDAEHRIIKALPKLAKAATCEKLKTAFLDHLEETKGQVIRTGDQAGKSIPIFRQKSPRQKM